MAGYCDDCGNTACLCPVSAGAVSEVSAERLSTRAIQALVQVLRTDPTEGLEVMSANAIEQLTAERDAALARAAALEAAGDLLLGYGVQMQDWDGPGSGTGHFECLPCRATWYGPTGDVLDQIKHGHGCPVARWRALAAERRGGEG